MQSGSEDKGVKESLQFNFALLADVYTKGLPGYFRDQVIEMALESHNVFLAGCNRASMILAAEALHHLNCELILRYLRVTPKNKLQNLRKEFTKYHIKIEDFEARDILLDKLTIFSGIELLRTENLIDEELRLDMHILRSLRNYSVHSSRFPQLNYYHPSTPLNPEDLREIIEVTFRGEPLPLHYEQYQFKIKLDNQDVDYVVDQKKLKINTRTLTGESRFAVIGLSIMLSCFERITQLFSKETFQSK